MAQDAEDRQSHSSQEISKSNNADKQTVLSLFGLELTAPAGLKNPGVIYLSFIVVNFILFLVLKSFLKN